MPGVVVTTATRSGPSAPLRAPSGQFFIAGITERGVSGVAVLVRSMSDVVDNLGNRVTYGAVYDQLNTFFDEGGQQAYVSRVVGPGATAGTLTLQDRAVTPVATLRIDAASDGAWSGNINVEVKNGTVADTFRITVTHNGEIVEDYNNIASPAGAVAKLAQSPYVRATDLGSATAAPNNNPAVLTATALSAGDDDRASVAAADYVTALDVFVPGLGDGAVAIPGQTGETVWNGIIEHCEANKRIALLAGEVDASVSSLKSDAGSLNSEYAGLFAPWIQVSDGASGARTISPEGFVAACRSRAHSETGPWRVPAGKIGEGRTILGLSSTFSLAEANDLDEAGVSVIRDLARSFRLYGWRSLSNDVDNYAYLKDRDLLNRLVVDAEKRLEDYVFQPIDSKGQLLSAINAELVGMVDPIRQAGGLYENYDIDGELIDPGYKVDTGSNVNTAQSLSNNEVRARLLVRVAPTGGLVSLTIVKVGILSGF